MGCHFWGQAEVCNLISFCHEGGNGVKHLLRYEHIHILYAFKDLVRISCIVNGEVLLYYAIACELLSPGCDGIFPHCQSGAEAAAESNGVECSFQHLN